MKSLFFITTAAAAGWSGNAAATESTNQGLKEFIAKPSKLRSEQSRNPFNPPLKNPPVKNTPVKNAPVKNAPVKNAPVKNAPVKNPKPPAAKLKVSVSVSRNHSFSRDSSYALACLRLFASKIDENGIQGVSTTQFNSAEKCLADFKRKLLQ